MEVGATGSVEHPPIEVRAGASAVLFPGQGAQRSMMGEPWVGSSSWPVVAAISEATGRDVEHLLLRADAATLRETRNTQLALFAIEVLVFDALVSSGFVPDVVAGHSVGEFAALVAAGCLDVGAGARLVLERSEAMDEQTRGRPGSMLAVMGLPVEQAAAHLGDHTEAWIAVVNGPGNVTVSGSTEGLAACAASLAGAGAKVISLQVAGAFHCPLMADAADRLGRAIDEAPWTEPTIPLISNVDGGVHRDLDLIVGLVRRQLCEPVQWERSMASLVALQPGAVVEAGPGRTLTRIATRAGCNGVRSVAAPEDLAPLP